METIVAICRVDLEKTINGISAKTYIQTICDFCIPVLFRVNDLFFSGKHEKNIRSNKLLPSEIGLAVLEIIKRSLHGEEYKEYLMKLIGILKNKSKCAAIIRSSY